MKSNNRRAKTPTSPPHNSNKVTILPRGSSVPNLPIFSNSVEGSNNLTVVVGQMKSPNRRNMGNRNNKPRRYSPSKSFSSGYSSASSSDESRSPKDNYAGARFHLPPQPEVLPKPPTHWVNNSTPFFGNPNTVFHGSCASEMSSHLKTILKVQVQAQ